MGGLEQGDGSGGRPGGPAGRGAEEETRLTERELAVYRRILGLAEDQRRHLAQGDLERFGRLMERRRRLFGLLGRLPVSAPEEARGPLIRRILAVDAENALLLRCAMEEARRGLAAVAAGRRAGRSYAAASLPSLSDGTTRAAGDGALSGSF